MNYRNTKQKEIILNVIKNDYTHPTIKEICQKVNEIDNSIGQATIYRMVKQLINEKKIIKISTDENHYDYVKEKHYHLLCNKCNKIIDIYDESIEKELKKIEKKNNIKIDTTSYLFEGLCNSCNNSI